MASLKVQDIPNYKLGAVVKVVNQQTQALGTMGVLPHYHSPFGADGTVTALVTAANASDLATSKTLAKALADALVAHGASTDKHSAADVIAIAAYASSPAEPANLTEVQNVLNEVKADFNTHIANATPHRGVGGAGRATIATVTTADASDQTTANALANALKAALNAHDSAGAQTIQVVDN